MKKADLLQFFRGKRVTVMGLDPSGRGVQDAAFLAQNGAVVTATDLKDADFLEKSLRKLSRFKKISFVLGEHRLQDFRNRDLVIRAAILPIGSPFVAEARSHKIPVETDETLFLKLAPDIVTVGVTGTRGKTTTTMMIYEIARAYFGDKKVHLAGNVKGKAALPLLKKISAGDIVVFELSSWQLQAFRSSKISPHIAVFTNFMRDHLNYYKGSMDLYWKDKTAIFSSQKKNDLLVVGSEVAERIADEREKVHGRMAVVKKGGLPKDWKLGTLGEHNRLNAAYALSVARALGIPDADTRISLESFGGVPGRLERLGTFNDILYINDTTATTPEAVFAALDAVRKQFPKREIILIGGGTDKILEFDEYARVVPSRVKHMILFAGTATEMIRARVSDRSKKKIAVVASMKEAMGEVARVANRGDIVLLSPGAASFGIFKNEYDRGDQFVREVKKLQ